LNLYTSGRSTGVQPIPHKASGRLDFVVMQPLPTDGRNTYSAPALTTLDNGDILLAYRDWGIPDPESPTEDVAEVSRIWVTRSTDGGHSWHAPMLLDEAASVGAGGPGSPGWGKGWRLTFARTAAGRIVLASDDWFVPDYVYYSDDDGITWSRAPFPTRTVDFINRIYGPIDGQLWYVTGEDEPGTTQARTVRINRSVDGIDWAAVENLFANSDPRSSWVLSVEGVVQLSSGDIVAALLEHVWWDPDTRSSVPYTCCPEPEEERLVSIVRSSDGGATWTVQQHIQERALAERNFYPYSGTALALAPDGTLWLLIAMRQTTPFYPYDIYYMTSTDDGVTWSEPVRFTEYAGMDGNPAITFVDGEPLVAFGSGRSRVENPLPWWVEFDLGLYTSGIWYGKPGTTVDEGPGLPPWISTPWSYITYVLPVEEQVSLGYYTLDETGIASTETRLTADGTLLDVVELYDDGSRDDGAANDGVYGGRAGPFEMGTVIRAVGIVTDTDGNVAEEVPHLLIVPPVQKAGNLSMTLELSGGFGPWLSTGYSTEPGGAPGLVWPATVEPAGSGTLEPLYEAGVYDHLFAGGFVVGVDSIPGQAGPHLTGWTDYNTTDWKRSAPTRISSTVSDQDISLFYTDTNERAPSADGDPGTVPLGLSVKQTSYQWAEPDRDDFIILEYEIQNTGAITDIAAMRAAIWLDLDLPLVLADKGYGFALDHHLDDQVAYDSQNRILYQFDSGELCNGASWPQAFPCPEAYVGVVWLSDRGGLDPSADTQPLFSRQWERMTSGVNPTLTSGVPLRTGRDYSYILTSLPFDLPSGETQVEAFGIVAGAGFADMVVNSVKTREVYETEVSKTSVAHDDPVDRLPRRIAPGQNYPNPLNRSTVISFDLPRAENVSLRMFDVLGREVFRLVDERRQAGRHHEEWDSRDMANGVYFYRLQAGEFTDVRTLTVLR
jgi:hypothetical protein